MASVEQLFLRNPLIHEPNSAVPEPAKLWQQFSATVEDPVEKLVLSQGYKLSSLWFIQWVNKRPAWRGNESRIPEVKRLSVRVCVCLYADTMEILNNCFVKAWPRDKN